MRRPSLLLLWLAGLPVMLASAPVRGAAPRDPSLADATLATVESGTAQAAVSATELRAAYNRAARQALTMPSAAAHQKLAGLALDLAAAGVTDLDGDPILLRAADHSLDVMLSTEASNSAARPEVYLGPAWTLMDRLLNAGATTEAPSVALAVEGAARRLARRFALAPLGEETEGWAGSEWHAEGQRLRDLFDLDYGNLGFVSRLWRAETVLADCSATFAAGKGGLEEATLQLRAASPRTTPARRRLSRDWASTHACALDQGRADDRSATADRLIQAALEGATPQEIATDAAMAWWIPLGLSTALDQREAARDVPGMLAVVERGLSPALQSLGWRERSMWAFNGAIRARNVATADDALSLEALRGHLESADGLTDQAFDQLYRADLARVDDATREQLLASLDTYALVCERYRDMPDRALRAGQLADRIRGLPASAAPVPPDAALAAGPEWPDPLAQMVADARLLAELSHDVRLPGDAGGERFANRFWLLHTLESLTARLARRAALPGALGDDARQDHVEALTWLGLAHAASGDRTGADLIFTQIGELDPAWLDLPFAGGADSPRVLRTRWEGGTVPEVRMILLSLPAGAPEITAHGSVHHADVEALATRDLTRHYRGWLSGDAGAQRWVAAWLPLGGDVELTVGTVTVALPPGDAAVVGRLEPIADRWSIATLPAPVPGRATP